MVGVWWGSGGGLGGGGSHPFFPTNDTQPRPNRRIQGTFDEKIYKFALLSTDP